MYFAADTLLKLRTHSRVQHSDEFIGSYQYQTLEPVLTACMLEISANTGGKVLGIILLQRIPFFHRVPAMAQTFMTAPRPVCYHVALMQTRLRIHQ